MQGSSLSEAVFTEDDTDAGIEDIDVDCSGLRREEWLHTPVMLVNDIGQNVAKGICCNVNPMDCVEDNYLGLDNVGVLIMEPLEGMMDMGWVFSLRMWPLHRVFHQRHTLAHHLLVSTRRLRVQNSLIERRKKEGRGHMLHHVPRRREDPPKSRRFSPIIASTNYLLVCAVIESVLDISLGKRH
jgi:hypothetical protein